MRICGRVLYIIGSHYPSDSFFGIFVVFIYFSSFWDASLIGDGGGFLCTSRCLGEHEILLFGLDSV